MADIEVELPDVAENGELPSPESVLIWELRQKRIFYINEDIDATILYFQGEIIRINYEDKGIPIEERKPIYFLINTNGGLLSETMSLASTMQMSKTPIITINVGAAYSGGVVLLLAGHKRYAFPFSKALIHTGSGELGGTHEQVKEQAAKYKREIDDMCNFILQRSGISKTQYSKKKSKEWYIIDEEQVKYGIVDGMIDNLFDLLGV